MVETTLDRMYQGGIFDHVGFGFCRYATDRKWLVPHFEKMLYDNALLLLAYLKAYQLTKRPLYREVSEKIIIFFSIIGKPQEGFRRYIPFLPIWLAIHLRYHSLF